MDGFIVNKGTAGGGPFLIYLLSPLQQTPVLSGEDGVYMGATHTRFEHSIGVAYLAFRLCEKIRSRRPD